MEEMEDSGFRSNRQTGKTGGCGCGGSEFSPGGGANPAGTFPSCNHRRWFHLQLPTGGLTFDPEAASVLRLPEPEDRRFFSAASGQVGEARNASPAPQHLVGITAARCD